jgi:hypothetical protein
MASQTPSTQKGGGWFGSSTSGNAGINYTKFYTSSAPTGIGISSPFSRGSANYTSEAGVNSGVIQYLYYFIVILIVILLVLVIVNYTFYPIFRTSPGGKGFIPVPGSDDSKLYWITSDMTSALKESTTPVSGLYQNWSYVVDIQVDNPTANTGAPRLLLSRGEKPSKLTSPFRDNDTILKLLPKFNTAIYLDKLTNDLYVSIQTISSTNPSNKTVLVESIPITNIPVRKSVRIGVMIASNVFEVYVNGYLVRSKTFTASIRNITGDFYPPSDTVASSTARVKNLRIWNRTLSSAEFRSYGGASDFDIKDIPDSCAV